MVKLRFRYRPAVRAPMRRNLRSVVRYPYSSCIRNLPGYRTSPDPLSQALTACRRAIRAHRKLERLAPEFFDSTEVDRLAHRRKTDAEWMALWEPALNKAYGPPPPDSPRRDPTQDRAQLPSSRCKRRAIDREFANWRFWIAAARLALHRHGLRRPRRVPSLTRIARLIDIGIEFGRLACGSFDPSREDHSHSQALADLERAYGRPLPDEEPSTPQQVLNIEACLNHG